MFRILLFCLALPVFAASQDLDFWWKAIDSYRESGDLALEEMGLKKILQIAPGDLKAREGMRLLEDKKKKKGSQGIDEKLKEINSSLDDKGQEEQELLKELASEDKGVSVQKKIDDYEVRLQTRGLSDVQKNRIREALAKMYFDLGIQAAEEERIRQAIEMFEKSVFYRKDFQLSHYELGYLYFKIRELKKGIASLEEFYRLQSTGILAQSVRATLLQQYIKIARKYFFKRDLDNCQPILKKIMSFDAQSAEAQTAMNYLMELYYFRGLDYLKVEDYVNASKSFYEALLTLKVRPEVDVQFFSRLAKSAVSAFLRYGQRLFLLEKDFGQATAYFEAVTWLVPGTPESLLAKEYIKEISRQNGTAQNPVIFFSNLIEQENTRFLLEERKASEREEGSLKPQ